VLIYKQDIYQDERPARLEKTKSRVSGHLRALLIGLDDFGVPLTIIQLQRMLDKLDHYRDHKELSDDMRVLAERLADEVEPKPYYLLAPDHLKYYTQPHLFGEAVDKSFPSALVDIEEAGKCYAVERSTACVFHLMRVMEVGLRALGKSLNNPDLDPKRNPSWEAILRKCDSELQKPLKDRSAEWRVDDAFFATATANLRAVKDAWRNPTMHVEIAYDPEKAFDVWNAVGAFMRHLSAKLTE